MFSTTNYEKVFDVVTLILKSQNLVEYNLYKWGARNGEYPDTLHSPVMIHSKKNL